MTISLFLFFETIAMAGGIELINLICGEYSFSLLSFVLIIFIVTFDTFIFMLSFSFINKNKN